MSEDRIDVTKRDALLRLVGHLQDVDIREDVSLETFFDGNDDGASIWCNLDCEPRPDHVMCVLMEIRARPEVHDVRIIVTQFDGGDDAWPFSDKIVFVTSATEADVLSWLGEAYAPDDHWTGDPLGYCRSIVVPAGHQLVTCFWD
ncbi:MAG: hypothetical protein AAFZ01_05615 [Pseudomonadota bacterium]